MKTDRWERILEIFNAALELPASRRGVYLEEACSEDEELGREVEALLESHDSHPDFLETPAARLADALPGESMEGRRVGRYRIVRRIGDGGMGTVYLAERSDAQYRMQVAVKLVKRGMDSEDILHRFRSEQQILAALQHPNIARLLDGGIAEGGRPYFVMEYVEGGVPIDRSCDQHKLGVTQRLQQFRVVCGAVHYAHQNLVIHRDLKPSNILVATDGQIKLLDFGIAKLLDPEQASVTVVRTRTEMRLLTPECASPEQARGEPVTTASDVYALGVLLYSLLTGRRPYRFTRGTAEEVRKIICEQDPDKPSRVVAGHEVATSEEEAEPSITAEEIAANRGSRPERLRRRLRGDLDNIVFMAMHKDWRRRYPSVEALSEDVQRYLENRPVLARQDSLGYRLQKFAARNRWGVAASVLILLSLLLGMAGTAWQARVATQERDRARQEAEKAERVAGLLFDLFDSSDPRRKARGDLTPVRDFLEEGEAKVLRELSRQPTLQVEMLDVLGRVYINLGQYQRARSVLEASLEKRRALPDGSEEDVAEGLFNLSELLDTMNEFEEAESLAREALAIYGRLFGERDARVADGLSLLARVRLNRENLAEAESLFREALATRQEVSGPKHPATVKALDGLGTLLLQAGRYDESEAVFRQALAIQKESSGEDHIDVASISSNLAVVLRGKGDYAGSEQMHLEALEIKRKWLGEEHPDLAQSFTALGVMRFRRADYEAAIGYMREALELWRKAYGDEHTMVALGLSNLGMALLEQGDYAAAEASFREALSIRQKIYQKPTAALAHIEHNLALALAYSGQYGPAEDLFRSALETRRLTLGEGHPLVAKTASALGRTLLEQGRWREAEVLLQQAIELNRKLFPQGHLDLAESLLSWAELLIDRGSAASAETVTREALEFRRAKLPSDHWRIHEAESLLGACFAAEGRYEEAEPRLLDSYQVLEERMGIEHFSTVEARERLATLYQAWGKPDRAARFESSPPSPDADRQE